jgi:hypothetical protein
MGKVNANYWCNTEPAACEYRGMQGIVTTAFILEMLRVGLNFHSRMHSPFRALKSRNEPQNRLDAATFWAHLAPKGRERIEKH